MLSAISPNECVPVDIESVIYEFECRHANSCGFTFQLTTAINAVALLSASKVEANKFVMKDL